MKISVLIGQFPITFNIYENLNQIKLLLEKSHKDDLVVLPEGALSGIEDKNMLKQGNGIFDFEEFKIHI